MHVLLADFVQSYTLKGVPVCALKIPDRLTPLNRCLYIKPVIVEGWKFGV